MLKFFFFLFSWAAFTYSYSQTSVSDQNNLQCLSELNVFTTPLEKQIFTSITFDKEVDYLALFLATDPSATSYKTQKDAIENFLSSSDLFRQPDFNAKRLKKIYSEIHNSFLSKYIDNPSFGEIFKNGNYNCATATALYALLLDKASIQYNIRETPQHVYIVAAPETHNIVFETTAPGARFMELNEKSKTQYVDFLYKNKIISKEEWTTTDKNKLFEKYFFNDEVIDKKKLAGILYYNAAIDATGKENFIEAYKNFEKAYFLYPSQKMKYFVMVTLASLVVEDKVKDDPDAYAYYLRFSDISERDVSRSMLGGYFEDLSKKLLFKSANPQKYWTLYNHIIPHISDSSLKKDILSLHYYNVAHYYSIKSKPDSSLLYLDSVYAYNNNDLLVQELITTTLFDKMRSITNEKALFDTLDAAFRHYTFIDKQSKLGEYYFYCLSSATKSAFDKNEKKQGDQYLAVIYDFIEKQPDLKKKYEQYFVAAFLESYFYYMGKAQYKEGKEFLTSVLKYYPANEELLERMKFVNKMLK